VRESRGAYSDTTGTPQAHHRHTTGTPQAHHRHTTGTPQAHHRQTILAHNPMILKTIQN